MQPKGIINLAPLSNPNLIAHTSMQAPSWLSESLCGPAFQNLQSIGQVIQMPLLFDLLMHKKQVSDRVRRRYATIGSVIV